MKPIEAEWNSFREKLLPKRASKQALQTAKRIFYAGASVMNLIAVQSIAAQNLAKVNQATRDIEAFGEKLQDFIHQTR